MHEGSVVLHGQAPKQQTVAGIGEWVESKPIVLASATLEKSKLQTTATDGVEIFWMVNMVTTACVAAKSSVVKLAMRNSIWTFVLGRNAAAPVLLENHMYSRLIQEVLPGKDPDVTKMVDQEVVRHSTQPSELLRTGSYVVPVLHRSKTASGRMQKLALNHAVMIKLLLTRIHKAKGGLTAVMEGTRCSAVVRLEVVLAPSLQ
jgi:hypothetical protein